MNRRRLLLVIVAILGFGTILVARLGLPGLNADSGNASYGVVTPAQLDGMLARKDFTFVNVHIPYAGEIDKTDAFIPYNEIDKNLAQLPANKNAKIVLYCQSGRMSSLAAADLAKRGYTNVSHLDGGMVAWQAAGNSTVDRQR